MILGVLHAQITMPRGEETRARAFYCELLGLRELEKPEPLRARGGLWLEVGALQVHIGAEDGVDRSKTKAHLAYEVDDLEAWRAKLAAARVEVTDGIQIAGFRRFELRDPFGNRI